MGSRTEVRARDDARALTAEPSDGGLAEGWVAVTGEVRTQSRTLGGTVVVLSLVAAALLVALIDHLGARSAVAALQPFVGFFAGLALYGERPVRGAVSVGHRAVRVVRDGRTREIPIVCASSYAGYGESLVRLESAEGERISIRGDEAIRRADRCVACCRSLRDEAAVALLLKIRASIDRRSRASSPAPRHNNTRYASSPGPRPMLHVAKHEHRSSLHTIHPSRGGSEGDGFHPRIWCRFESCPH